MRKLVITVVALELLALTACGYTLASDRQLTDAVSWTREFKAEQPAAARAIAKGCMNKLTGSTSFDRDGALQLLTCIRRDAESRGLA